MTNLLLLTGSAALSLAVVYLLRRWFGADLKKGTLHLRDRDSSPAPAGVASVFGTILGFFGGKFYGGVGLWLLLFLIMSLACLWPRPRPSPDHYRIVAVKGELALPDGRDWDRQPYDIVVVPPRPVSWQTMPSFRIEGVPMSSDPNSSTMLHFERKDGYQMSVNLPGAFKEENGVIDVGQVRFESTGGTGQ